MSKVFAVVIRRGKKVIFKHSVSSVRVPGINGPVTIMTGHRPADLVLDVGVIKVVSFDGRSLCFAVDGGHVLVQRNGLVVESSRILLPEEIEESDARRDLEYANEILTAAETPPGKLGAAKHAQAWAAARIEALACHKFPAPADSRTRLIRLSDHLSEENVIMELAGTDKWEVIEELVDWLTSTGQVPQKARQSALDAVVSREKMMSTALGGGLAIPHGSCKKAKGVAIALGIARKGVDFNALDQKPVHLVILAVVKPATFKLYVRTLGGIARLFRSGRLLEDVLSEESADAVLERIRRAERELLIF